MDKLTKDFMIQIDYFIDYEVIPLWENKPDGDTIDDIAYKISTYDMEGFMYFLAEEGYYRFQKKQKRDGKIK